VERVRLRTSLRWVTGALGLRRVVRYDAFGKLEWPAGAEPSVTVGFTGHEGEPDVGWVNMGGRMYDPMLGRPQQQRLRIALEPRGVDAWNSYTTAAYGLVTGESIQDALSAANDALYGQAVLRVKLGQGIRPDWNLRRNGLW